MIHFISSGKNKCTTGGSCGGGASSQHICTNTVDSYHCECVPSSDYEVVVRTAGPKCVKTGN